MYEERSPKRRRPGRVVFWVLYGICAAALIGGAVTTITTGRAFTVPSVSMENTIRPGDEVVVDRTTQVHRGDVIVEQQPSHGYFIRRVIGLPGDHVVCCDPRGRITVNGKALDETYLYPADAPSKTRFDVVLPEGKFWLLGDYRSQALDSRIEGPLAIHVVGRVFLTVRSGHSIFLRTPHTFVADGLAPASGPALTLIGSVVLALAFILLLALSIFGIIRFAIRRRSRSDPSEPHSIGFPDPGRDVYDQRF